MSKRCLPIVAFAFILLAASAASAASAVSVGVKQGDWIEYQVTVTGTPPQGHDAKWAKMEVAQVQGNAINLNVTTQFTNSSYLYENITLNLETGQLGDDFFVPANLNVGDVFFDANAGNITINGMQEKTYVGVSRTVVSGSTPQTSFFWDQQTGILVEAHSNYPNLNFTMTTIADKTNIWQPQSAQTQPTALYLAIGIATAVMAVVVAVLVLRRKRAI